MALALATTIFPNTCPTSYHVFLSFSGDTRKTFTDHLYTAFVNSGFRTFRDDDELPRGQDIKPELRKAIEQSQSSVIVFSKDYASSGWCLDELVMIMERKRTCDHIVLPVFYDVDPSQVRKQTGSLAKAFARHERNHSLKDKVKRWRVALTEVADLAGMVLQNEADGHESKFIKKIVRVMEDKLRRIPLSVEPHLIGINSQTEDINLWLQDGSADVGILLIHGIRGIGKSTIAKFVYNSNSQRFERCSFLENVREVSEQSNGLLRLQKQLLNDILSGSKVKIHNISEGMAKIEDAVSSKRVFLVLDDVDHVDQLAALLRIQNRFHPGSKIIITSSCAGLLGAHCQIVKVHEVRTLGKDESLALFSWHAFGQDHPIESYTNHSKRVIDHCGGLPLALKVLGSSLSGKNLLVWESALNKLKAIPNGEIMKKLKISYDSLQDDHDRNLFLHIACFFIGMEKGIIVTILDDCDFFTEVGIQNLIDRCFLTTDKDNKLVQMHDMIRDMGREIVRLESKEPERRSRVWHHKDSFKILSENIGTQTIEGLVLNMQMYPSRNSSKVVLETNAFTRMHKLRLLQLSHVQLSGRYEEFPAGLRWLCWIKFPLASLPTDFPLESLVALEMCYSSLRRLWRGTKYLPSLKILNLSHSHDFIEISDFSCIPNLERLILEDCARLVSVHESIGVLERRLIYLSVKDCKNLRMLPENISILTFLETLVISGCSNLREFPTEMRKLQSLKVFQADGVPIHRLLVTTTREVELCSSPIQELSWASNLPRNLVNLSLRCCNLLDDDFPCDFANLLSLQTLDLSGNPISRLPDCIRGVTGLRDLSLSYCTKLKSLLRLPAESLHFSVTGCTSLEKVTFQSFWGRDSWWGSNHNLVEVQGKFKMEPIERVDKEMLKLLSLGNLETLENISMVNSGFYAQRIWKGTHPVQGLYENGIFSTFLPGDEVPGQFSHRSRGSSVSFTVPLLPNLNIRGLNVFSVIAQSNDNDSDPMTNNVNIDGPLHPTITVVINKSKGLKWIYGPLFSGVPGEGKDVIWLSHWKFGNRLTCGDEVTILIYTKSDFKVKECGIQLVYYDEKDHVTSTTDDPCFLRAGVRSTIPSHPGEKGITFLCYLRKEIDENIDLIRDINEKSEKEEGQVGDLVLTLAAQSGSNSNKRGLISRGWKGIMMATILILSLPLLTRSPLFQQRKKQQSTCPS
ncbi:disease resistance protein RUN1 [Rosa chinensis]|nr:disease resistance protein RUN1 [Rosa chinensis]XP_040364235.1 disease resistance protein RUN1 [Rosa chinensis]XP_040364236.1 disease resistance protein RUN1 [Rosa chinensis]